MGRNWTAAELDVGHRSLGKVNTGTGYSKAPTEVAESPPRPWEGAAQGLNEAVPGTYDLNIVKC